MRAILIALILVTVVLMVFVERSGLVITSYALISGCWLAVYDDREVIFYKEELEAMNKPQYLYLFLVIYILLVSFLCLWP